MIIALIFPFQMPIQFSSARIVPTFLLSILSPVLKRRYPHLTPELPHKMCITAKSDLLGDLRDAKLRVRQQPFGSFQSCIQYILHDGDAVTFFIQPLQVADAEVIPSCDPGKIPVLLRLGMNLKMQMLDLLLRAGRKIVPDPKYVTKDMQLTEYAREHLDECAVKIDLEANYRISALRVFQ